MTEGTITFKAWFIVRADNSIQMIDSGDAAMHGCDSEEEWFGPYSITIPTPPRIRQCLDDRGLKIEGKVGNA